MGPLLLHMFHIVVTTKRLGPERGKMQNCSYFRQNRPFVWARLQNCSYFWLKWPHGEIAAEITALLQFGRMSEA
jgi:hypothetical protein